MIPSGDLPSVLLELGSIALRTAIVYGVLLGGLRLAGKREIGQMTPFDLVVLLVISNSVQSAMVGADVSLAGGIVSAFTLLGANHVVGRLGRRFTWLRHELAGTPTLVVSDGRILDEHLRREGLTADDVLQALREHGIDDLRGVKAAVLEVDGTMSVIAADAPSTRTRRRVRGRKPAA